MRRVDLQRANIEASSLMHGGYEVDPSTWSTEVHIVFDRKKSADASRLAWRTATPSSDGLAERSSWQRTFRCGIDVDEIVESYPIPELKGRTLDAGLKAARGVSLREIPSWPNG